MNNMPKKNLITTEHKKNISYGLLTVIISYAIISYGVSLFAFESPTQDQRWETSVTTGGPYSIGQQVTLTGALEQGISEYFSFTSPEDITWAILVIDSSNKPIRLEYGTRSAADGDLILDVVQFNLPDGTSAGLAQVRVIVWSGLLPIGETRTHLVHEGTFMVI